MASTETPLVDVPPPTNAELPEQPLRVEEKSALPPEKPQVVEEVRDVEKSAPPPRATEPRRTLARSIVGIDVVLRLLLFASTLTGLVVLATSDQTKIIPVPIPPFFLAPVESKFTDSPALIYFIAALSVGCLYSILTTIVSLLAFVRPGLSNKLLVHFVLLDVLLLGILASATGSAGAVAYLGLKGNSHTGWNKICNIYDTFCRHLAGSLVVSLIASITLVFLVWLSVYTLSKKIPKY